MQNTYKKSNYNHFAELPESQFLCYNTLTNAAIIINKNLRAEYDKIQENGMNINKTLFKDFIEKKFLIPSDYNELNEIKRKHQLGKYARKSLGLTIAPTLSCNFACTYCYEPSFSRYLSTNYGVMSNDIEDFLVNYVNNELEPKTQFQVTWYGGEPTLSTNRIISLSRKFLKISEKKESKYISFMVTNGYLLKKETCEKLLECNIKGFQITIDGTKEIHDERRPHVNGGGTYENILKNIELITENENAKVTIRMNVDHRNKNSLDEFLNDLKVRNLNDRKNISVYIAPVDSEVTPDGELKHCLKLKEFSEIEIYFLKKLLEMGFQLNAKPGLYLSNCTAVNPRSCIVLPNGEIHKCWNTVGASDLAVGQLNANGIDFNLIKMNKWLTWSPFMESCVSCSVLPLCMGGCPYKSIQSNENIGECKSIKYNLQERMQLKVDDFKAVTI